MTLATMHRGEFKEGILSRMTAKSFDPTDMINRPDLPEEWLDQLVVGKSSVLEAIGDLVYRGTRAKRHGTCRIAIDSHLGVPWSDWIEKLKVLLEERDLKTQFISTQELFKKTSALQKMVGHCLPEDPVFGQVFGGGIDDFFDSNKLARVRDRIRSLAKDPTLKSKPDVVICYGSGALRLGPRNSFDATLYIDLCREEILKRLKLGLATGLGNPNEPAKKAKPGKSALPAYFSTRRFYYVDYPVLDKHRKKILKSVDYYIDGNDLENPKMLPSILFSNLLDRMISGPVKPKPYYDPGPWGGQWLKKVRKLPKKMVNCAWSYDLIEPEASFQVQWGPSTLEIPFPVLTTQRPRQILGAKGSRPQFRGQLPIRINYDDSFKGDDMALQCHPGDKYAQEHFNEPFRQDESYYIVDTAPGSKVYLGLNEDADVEEFREAVLLAEKKGKPFDHTQFVNSIPSKPGDLFLIPSGTLHGSGKNEVVLEISATTYRYTFHFYDYLRPGLDGKLRSIHSDHAFAALKQYRRADWVKENLVQKPQTLRKGRNWSESIIGARHDMFFKVHRLEFKNRIEDDTNGDFHLLIPVEGKGVRIRPKNENGTETELSFSYVALLPATMGPYSLHSVDGSPCTVVKVLMA